MNEKKCIEYEHKIKLGEGEQGDVQIEISDIEIIKCLVQGDGRGIKSYQKIIH